MRLRYAALSALLAAGGLAAVAPAGAADDPWAGVSWATPTAVSPAGVDVDRGGVWQLEDGSQLALWSVYDHPSDPADGARQPPRNRGQEGMTNKGANPPRGESTGGAQGKSNQPEPGPAGRRSVAGQSPVGGVHGRGTRVCCARGV